jgi:hypothetical protein
MYVAINVSAHIMIPDASHSGGLRNMLDRLLQYFAAILGIWFLVSWCDVIQSPKHGGIHVNR